MFAYFTVRGSILSVRHFVSVRTDQGIPVCGMDESDSLGMRMHILQDRFHPGYRIVRYFFQLLRAQRKRCFAKAGGHHPSCFFIGDQIGPDPGMDRECSVSCHVRYHIRIDACRIDHCPGIDRTPVGHNFRNDPVFRLH